MPTFPKTPYCTIHQRFIKGPTYYATTSICTFYTEKKRKKQNFPQKNRFLFSKVKTKLTIFAAEFTTIYTHIRAYLMKKCVNNNRENNHNKPI